jgi:hypothetical protein
MNRASTLALVATALLATSLGCELITPIDRSKVDGLGGAGGEGMTAAPSPPRSITPQALSPSRSWPRT